MGAKRFQVLRRLKQAVKKVRFLLSFSTNKWFMSSIARSPGSHRLSYKRQPSLLDCGGTSSAGELDDENYFQILCLPTASLSPEVAKDRTVTRTISSLSRFSKTTSGSSEKEEEEEDVDRRADDFIAKFYKHIQMERQVSLELRYCRN
ncbi:hypothetical protein J5N97_002574 [Dioscorea zingiberensis]|uniref:Uncharacterized protein n=1 Tax=Dioscorea zingiberensis TaxID=325984 RepID=A0A9D5D505_9LILI|nr:hypothetical protein J5N97_002574 [Dioscorea zingiberensis]